MSDYWPDAPAGPLFSMSRKSDHVTSALAAESVRETGTVLRHERAIVAALMQGPAGKCGIARRCDLTEQQVNRRLAGMRRQGLIERTGVTVLSDSGCFEHEYRVTDSRKVEGAK